MEENYFENLQKQRELMAMENSRKFQRKSSKKKF